MRVETAIRNELCKAARRLGADVARTEQLCSLPRDEIYGALADLAGDRLLLAIVDAWRKSADEVGVLKSLQAWNCNGDFKFFRLPDCCSEADDPKRR